MKDDRAISMHNGQPNIFLLDNSNLGVTLDEMNLINHFGLSYQAVSWTAILLPDTSKY